MMATTIVDKNKESLVFLEAAIKKNIENEIFEIIKTQVQPMIQSIAEEISNSVCRQMILEHYRNPADRSATVNIIFKEPLKYDPAKHFTQDGMVFQRQPDFQNSITPD